MKTRFILILIAIALGFLVLSFSIVGLVGEKGTITRSEFMDVDLFKIRILDWINQERAKNGLSALNLDDKLNEIAYKEGLKISNGGQDAIESLQDQELTQIAASYDYQCKKQDGSFDEIHGIFFPSEHIRFRQIEPVVDWYLSQIINDENISTLLFEPDFEKTGIAITMSTEKFYVFQLVC